MIDPRRGSFALAAAAALVVAPASAQVAPAANAPEADNIIVTAQRRNETQVMHDGQLGALGEKAAADVPFAIKSYNAALILNQQPQTLGQVLENDPSIRTTYGFGNAAEQFVIRGFILNGDDVGFDGLYGITPRQLVAPELYEQVQVLNGASAFLNGAAPGGSGIGGSVNLVPKRASGTDLFRATANYASAAHLGGSFDASRRFANGDVGIRLNGAYRAGDVGVDSELRRTEVVGGAFDYRGATVRLSVDLAYQRARVEQLRPKVTVATATIPKVPDGDHNYGQPFTYTDLRDFFGSVRSEWQVADNAVIYASLGARDGSEDGIYGGITVTDAATGAATGNALYVPRADNNEAAQAGIRVKLRSGGLSQELNVGASALRQVNRSAYDFRYGLGFAGFDTNLYVTPPVTLPGSTLVGGDLADPFPVSRTRLSSAFAADTIGLFRDRVLVTVGLRLQTLQLTSYSYVDGARTSLYDEDAVTPVVGVVLKPWAGVSLYANRIESLAQGPTAPLSALDPVAGAMKPVVNAGEVFAPYRAIQYEVGGKLAFGPVTAGLALYSTSQPIGQVAADPADAAFLRYGLFADQRNRGVELTIDGEVTRGLRVIAGGALTRAKLRGVPGGVADGNDAPGIPVYTANANLEWDVPFLPGFTMTGRAVRTGKQQVNIANTLEISAWTRLDLGARFVASIVGIPLTLRANVDNVADNRYWASAFDTFSQALLQGIPRTYKASLSADF